MTTSQSYWPPTAIRHATVQNALLGDPKAKDALVQIYSSLIGKTSRRSIRKHGWANLPDALQREIIQEVLQETWTRVLAIMEKDDPENPVRTSLIAGVGRNVTLQQLHELGRERTAQIRAFAEKYRRSEMFTQEGYADPGFLEKLQLAEHLDYLDSAIEALPGIYRIVIRLFVMERADPALVAQMIGQTKNTLLKKTVPKAIRALANRLEPILNEVRPEEAGTPEAS